jgi:hypothetical protein
VADLRAVVWCEEGIWRAACPRPWCIRNIEWFGHGPVTGRVGGLTGTAFHCTVCGLVCPADWPTNRADIERVLAQRPFALTRNWLPAETLHDLIVENVEHGLIDPDPITERTILAAGDHLTDVGRQLVAAGPPLAIGG